MEILFHSNRVTAPELSIVLLDWSYRESFHIFDYLSSQAVDRSKFEILWVEYYETGEADRSGHPQESTRPASIHPLISGSF